MSRFIQREYPEKLIDSETKKVILNTSEKLIGKNKIKNGLPFVSLPFVRHSFSLQYYQENIYLLYTSYRSKGQKRGMRTFIVEEPGFRINIYIRVSINKYIKN